MPWESSVGKSDRTEVSKVENVLLKLIAKAEVQANLEAEKQAEAERYAKGVEAMKRSLEFARWNQDARIVSWYCEVGKSLSPMNLISPMSYAQIA
jgi:hypothetical protein